MIIETLSEESFEGWAKLGVFALSLAFICGLVFLFMKVSEWKEKVWSQATGDGTQSQAAA